MTAVNPAPPPPRPTADIAFAAAWAVVAVALAALGFVLQPVWASKPELADRFLIPLAAGWLVYRAWPKIRTEPRRPSWLGLGLLAAGSVAFAFGWYLAVEAGGRPLVVWLLTLAFIAIVLGLAAAHGGWRRAAWLAFPLLFCLFMLPTPGRVYNPLQMRLKEATTRIAATTLPWLGVPVTREPGSFALTRPNGTPLSVVDACSGIRSVTALTAIAVLIAYLRGFGPIRGLVLVGLTMGVVAVCNSLRIVATGVLQEYFGQWAIEGWRHEALGIAAILAGLGLIVVLSGLIAPRQRPTPVEPKPVGERPASTALAAAALAILLPAAGVCAWAERYREDHRVLLKLEELSDQLGPWQGQTLEVPETVKDELNCDQVVRKQYRNDARLGEEVEVWVMFWANSAATANLHHPDICYTFNGWTCEGSRATSVATRDGRAHPVSLRNYSRRGQHQALFFWTQHGAHLLPEGVEAGETLSGHSWVLRLLKEGHKPVDRGARMSVLIGTPTRGSAEAGEKLLADFTREFVADLYRIAPWAEPRGER